MLVSGYLGEANFIDVTLGFVVGMIAWLLIIYEIFCRAPSLGNLKIFQQNQF